MTDIEIVEIHDDVVRSRATIIIDDHELSMVEFGRLLTTYAGWGMRIVSCPTTRSTRIR